jgi:hypothetical protein
MNYLIKNSSEILSASATLLAAFAGSWFAFKFQRGYELRKNIDQNLNVYNMSFIRLFHQYNDLLVIKKYFISEIDKDPINWLNIPALSEQKVLPDPDLSTLSFLIQYGKSDIISDIIIANQKYEVCINIINIRSDLHLNKLQPILERITPIDNLVDKDDIEKELGPKLIGELKNITKEIEEMIPETIQTYEVLLGKITEYGKVVFPKRKILSYK